jgi:hypothetical protein
MLLSRWLNPTPPATQPATRWRPALEALEERTVLTTSSIVSNFNGTAIAGGNYLWFSSVFKASGVGSAPVTIHVTDQDITFATKNGTQFDVAVPDADITLSPSTTAATATTTFDAASGHWVTNLPSSFSGNGFLSGVSFQAPAGGLPGGINPVTWKANFTTDTAGVSLNWQWAAAVYKGTGFSGDVSALGVKPLDVATSASANSDHAGTPEAFRQNVLGGARGGGGSNFTGSYSATGHVTPDVASISLSGHVYDSGVNGLPGMTVTLTDSLGNLVAQTTTLWDGSYKFTGVAAGTYNVTAGSGFGVFSVGTVNNMTDGTPNGAEIDAIGLNPGDQGINYDFIAPFSGPGS